jgi:GR25 family glycosyltransferase involved in LPS biosynthesis
MMVSAQDHAFNGSGPAQGEIEQALRQRAHRKPLTINDFFGRVIVVNLDRRPSRWANVTASLQRAGIRAERFSAIDGQAPDVLEEFEAYVARPSTSMEVGELPIRNFVEFYRGDGSQTARVAFIEQSMKRKAVTSGAWGYLKSMFAILQKALKDSVTSVLVLDDDVTFHRRTVELFAAALVDLPDDWRILQLGTMQHEWTDEWISWYSPLLYRQNFGAIGSHAVGIRAKAIPFLLKEIARMDLPYDVGPLSAAARTMPTYVMYPNIAIQRLDTPSDISSSGFIITNSKEEVSRKFRWILGDYE